MKLEILYEDAYLLACVKPYGVLSQGDKGNDEDMITKIKQYPFLNLTIIIGINQKIFHI